MRDHKITIEDQLEGWVYAAFSNHGGENDIIKIGFSTDPMQRFRNGNREIFHFEADISVRNIDGYRAGNLEQDVLEFMESLGLRVSRIDSLSNSEETIRCDAAAVSVIRDALPSKNLAINRFLLKVLNYLGPTGNPSVRPNLIPGKIMKHQTFSRLDTDNVEDALHDDWSLLGIIEDEDVNYRPASRGARSGTGLNPEDWNGLRRQK